MKQSNKAKMQMHHSVKANSVFKATEFQTHFCCLVTMWIRPIGLVCQSFLLIFKKNIMVALTSYYCVCVFFFFQWPWVKVVKDWENTDERRKLGLCGTLPSLLERDMPPHITIWELNMLVHDSCMEKCWQLPCTMSMG